MKELDLSSFQTIDIKKENISKEDLQLARKAFDSYIELFNKRARKIKALELELNSLSEQELEQHILDEYSFLKRPLMIDGDTILAGNAKKTVAQMIELHGNS